MRPTLTTWPPMPDPSYGRHGRSVMKREAALLEAEAVERQAAVVAANRVRLRMDAPAVDPTLLRGAQAVFVRGRGWFFVKTVNQTTATAFRVGLIGFERIPFAQIVDYR